MDKIIDTKNIQYTQYDKNSPTETGAFIIDWLDGIYDYDIKDVIDMLDELDCLNAKGKEVLKHFDEARKLMDSTFTPDKHIDCVHIFPIGSNKCERCRYIKPYEVKNDTTKGDM